MRSGSVGGRCAAEGEAWGLRSMAAGVVIEPGTRADLRALEPFHYLRGEPGPVVRVLRAVEAGETVGVVAVSMPPLNGAWRRVAWPGVFEGMPARERAAALNARVRTISRVIVEPRRRSEGIGAALVRAYLAEPLTAWTEAIASMGRFGALFERAGMRRVEMARPARDLRVLDALEARSFTPLDLLDARRALRVLRDPVAGVEVDRWLNAGRATRWARDASAAERGAIVAKALIARPVAYVRG